MSRLPLSTIEQWGVLRAVVEEGGFAQAAEALNRSQSSVSYMVARLKETLGVELLEQQGRRAVLTEAGTALLAEAIPVIDELARLERRSRAISGGEAVEIRLIVDAIFPKERLFAALARFAELHPHVEVHLLETVRQTMADVRADDFDLAVLTAEPGAKWSEVIAETSLIAVASPLHPLLRDGPSPGEATLAHHTRAEIRGMESGLGERGGEGRIWRMNTVETAIEAVRRGLCYGWLPGHMIADDFAAGRLVRLDLGIGSVRRFPLGLRFRDRREPPGTPVSRLADLLAGRAVEEPST